MKRFDRLGTVDQLLLVILMASTVTFLFPYSAAAQTTNQKPVVFEIKTLPKIPTYNDLAPQSPKEAPVVKSDEQIAQEKLEANAAVLQAYLEKKGSPLAPFAKDIIQNENWKLVLAISNGESTMCKHQKYNNCWGVGGAWNLKHYSNFAEGFSDVNRFLTAKYVAQGADTPQEIVNKYVGHSNGNWVVAVNQVLTQIDQLPLQE